jgi:multiple sugar transport system ATP-binding protein
MNDEAVQQDKEFPCVIGLRPEQVLIFKEKKEGSIEGKVYACQAAGSETLITVQAGNCEFLVKQMGIHKYKMNSMIYINIDSEKMNVYDEASTRLIKLAKLDAFEG